MPWVNLKDSMTGGHHRVGDTGLGHKRDGMQKSAKSWNVCRHMLQRPGAPWTANTYRERHLSTSISDATLRQTVHISPKRKGRRLLCSSDNVHRCMWYAWCQVEHFYF